MSPWCGDGGEQSAEDNHFGRLRENLRNQPIRFPDRDFCNDYRPQTLIMRGTKVPFKHAIELGDEVQFRNLYRWYRLLIAPIISSFGDHVFNFLGSGYVGMTRV